MSQRVVQVSQQVFRALIRYENILSKNQRMIFSAAVAIVMK